MIARPVLSARGVDVVQPRNYLKLILERRERLHRRSKLKLLALPFGPPLIEVDAIGNRDKRQSLRHAGRRLSRGATRQNVTRPRPLRQQRRQRRQSHTSSNATKKPAPS